MKHVMVCMNDDLYLRLKEEVKKKKWASMAEGIRYYTRRGMEIHDSSKS